MKDQYHVSNADELLRKYEPLICKYARQFHNRYNAVIDLDDAKQEIRLLFYKCLRKYDDTRTYADGQTVKFVTYFKRAFGLMMSRFYHTHKSNININQKRIDPSMFGEDCDSGTNRLEEIGALGKVEPKRSVRPFLSKEAKEVWDVLMYDNRANPFSVHKKLGLSRLYAKKRYDSFVDEVKGVHEFISEI